MLKGKDIIKRRKKFGYSQEYLANLLGMSRPTLARLESGNRTLTVPEDVKLRELFGVINNAIYSGVRADIPKKNIEKFKQVLLYVTNKVGAQANVGMTVLYKLLYFIDFDYYEKYEEQMMGLTYFKNTYGPAPREFLPVVNEMKVDGLIEEIKAKHFMHDQRKFLPVKSPDLSLLSGNELKMIDSVLAKYADKSATELTRLSHLDTPWDVAEMGEDLKYEHAFYRTEEFSVGEYDEL